MFKNNRIQTKKEIYSCSYTKLEKAMQSHNKKIVMLVGPIACGKSTAVKQYCAKNYRACYSATVIKSVKELLGFVGEDGEYQKTAFAMAYVNGEIFYLDQLTNCPAELLKELIKIQREDSYKFPFGVVKKHPGFRIIVSVDLKNSQVITDKVRSNFEVVNFKYDRAVEMQICPNPELYEFITELRKISLTEDVKIDVTTYTYKKIYEISKLSSFSKRDVIFALIRGDYYTFVIETLIEKMNESIPNNSYFKELKLMGKKR